MLGVAAYVTVLIVSGELTRAQIGEGWAARAPSGLVGFREMCGIAGQVRSDVPARRESHGGGDVRRPAAPRPRLAGHPRAEGVGLGIQRLRIIDLDTGDQPIYNEDRTVAVVLNGEIYNYRELRERLAATRPRLRARSGDTEVIAHLYEEQGARLRRASCTACSRSRSGTRAGGSSCSRATGSARSRSSTPSATAALSFASELARCCRTPRSRASSTTQALDATSPTATCRRR